LPFNFLVLPCGLPAWFAIVTTTVAAAIATATAAAAAVATTATAATTVTTTATTISSGLGFIDRQITTAKVFAIELFDCGRRFFRRSHFHERKPA
jgi:hypothetical protein